MSEKAEDLPLEIDEAGNEMVGSEAHRPDTSPGFDSLKELRDVAAVKSQLLKPVPQRPKRGNKWFAPDV